MPPERSTIEIDVISAETDGGRLYETICQGCHMPDARGAKGAGTYPALAGNPKLGSPAYPQYLVLHGQGGMPGFGKWLNDEQIANVLTYVRNSFGNSGEAVAIQEVTRIRQQAPPPPAASKYE